MKSKKKLIKEAFHEIKKNPPSTLKKQSKEKMRKQEVAIALSKARKKGAKIPWSSQNKKR